MSCCFGFISIHKTETNHSIYHINNVTPSDEDITIATNSWIKILSATAEGFLHAKETKTIDEHSTPIIFFYNTFFDIWKKKDATILENIYKNNVKIKSKSMIAMVAFILKCKKHTTAEILQMVKHHNMMGIKTHHFSLMGEVIIETIMTVLDKKDYNHPVIVAWRNIMSYMVEKIELATTLKIKHNSSPAHSIRGGGGSASVKSSAVVVEK